MRIPRTTIRPWVATAGIVAAAAILLTVLHQGDATANTGPPDTPGNPLAHLIVPSNEDPRIRLSWDTPDTPVSGYTITRTDGQEFPSRRHGHHVLRPLGGAGNGVRLLRHGQQRPGLQPSIRIRFCGRTGRALGARQPYRSRSRTRGHRRNGHRRSDVAGIHGAST